MKVLRPGCDIVVADIRLLRLGPCPGRYGPATSGTICVIQQAGQLPAKENNHALESLNGYKMLGRRELKRKSPVKFKVGES
jgi:hypothetical protein